MPKAEQPPRRRQGQTFEILAKLFELAGMTLRARSGRQHCWELDRNPWLVRNLLDNFVAKYSYTDEIKIYKSEAALAAPQGQAFSFY